MDEFKSRYLKECSAQKYEANDNILSAMRESHKSNLKSTTESVILNLSGCSISVVDCGLLAKCLATDTQVEEYRFTDCLLSEDASRIIINALSFNKTIKLLDIKGNNLRSAGAELISKLLKRTTSLQQLFLEWNNIGMWDSGIKAIAEGLAVNQTLHVLDLSNNQISHEGGQDVAAALKRNKTLGILDMRWNNVGVLGGRAFLSALDHNKYISNLQLAGNNIPADIMKAMGTALKRNLDYRSIFEEQESMRRSLKQEIDHIHHEKSMQVSTLMNQLEKEKVLHETLNESTRDQVHQMKAAVEGLKNENHSLHERNTSLQTDLMDLQHNHKELQLKIRSKDHEITDLCSKHTTEIADLAHILEEEQKNKKEVELVKDDQMYGLKKQLRETLDQLETERNELNKLTYNIKKQKAEHNEEISSIVQKNNNEKNEQHNTSNSQMKNLQDKIRNISEQKDTLENEVSQLKSSCLTEKLRREEEIMTLQSKWKQEELLKTKQYDDRIDLLISTKDELQSKASKLSVENTQLNTQFVNTQKELEHCKRQIDQQQQLINQRDLEHRNEINRVRLEADSEKRIVTELRDKIQSLESKHQEVQSHLREEKSANEAKVKKLNEIIRQKENDMKRMREEELRRASLLESALQTYITSARSSSYL